MDILLSGNDDLGMRTCVHREIIPKARSKGSKEVGRKSSGNERRQSSEYSVFAAGVLFDPNAENELSGAVRRSYLEFPRKLMKEYSFRIL